MKAAFEYTCICIELNDMNGKLKQIYSWLPLYVTQIKWQSIKKILYRNFLNNTNAEQTILYENYFQNGQ